MGVTCSAASIMSSLPGTQGFQRRLCKSPPRQRQEMACVGVGLLCKGLRLILIWSWCSWSVPYFSLNPSVLCYVYLLINKLTQGKLNDFSKVLEKLSIELGLESNCLTSSLDLLKNSFISVFFRSYLWTDMVLHKIIFLTLLRGNWPIQIVFIQGVQCNDWVYVHIV